MSLKEKMNKFSEAKGVDFDTETEIDETPEEELLKEVSTHRFRSNGDVTPYLFREWQKLSNNFVPTNVLKHFRYFNIDTENKKLLQTIKKQQKKIICINDGEIGADFDRVKQEVQQVFSEILPEVSSFERTAGKATE